MKDDDTLVEINAKSNENEKKKEKKKKRNLWPLKAFIISLVLAFVFNAASELLLKGDGASLTLAFSLTAIILVIGVLFDMIGTASTACDIEPFHAMASRKVKGAKMAVKLAKNSNVVSSVCNDVIGDICGIVSGVCAASIVGAIQSDFFWSVFTYAIVSTLTITFKALGKGIAVNKANDIIYGVAKVLSIFDKD